MMRAAIVKNGVVQNVIEVESLDSFPGLVEATDGAEPGAVYDGSRFVAREKTAEEIAQAALRELEKIDLGSIRALREYVAAQPDAPQWLKDKEQAAQAARAKLKGGA